MPPRQQHTTKRKPYQNYSHPSFNWLDLLRAIGKGAKQAKIARERAIPRTTLQTQYNDWVEAGRPTTNSNTPHTGMGGARGHASRSLTDEAEHVLANLTDTRRNLVPTHDRHIQQMARNIHAQTHAQQLLDNSETIATGEKGSIRPVHASIHWLHDFKLRNCLINTHHPIIRPYQQKDKSHSTTLFYSLPRSTLPYYPPHRVINMDKTPLPFAPSKLNVISKIGDPTTLCTGAKYMIHPPTHPHTLFQNVVAPIYPLLMDV